ncbi:MAG: TrkA family potassium uptake protein [Deltaproteobacteria bacterium]|nr:TrkA family potassium uptake protein [Deltaproteobacteria bacterium]
MKKKKRFVVIGLGKFGYHVARTLYEDGHEVVAIDRDQERVQRMDAYATEAIVLDATDKDKLAVLGLKEVDAAVVSTGSDTSRSILITLYLNELGVKHILAKALNEDHGKILSRVGAREIIEPEKAMALRIAKGLSAPNMIDFLPLEKGYSLLQIAPPKSFVGKTLAELNLRARFKIYVIAIKELVPDNFVIVPPASFVIKDSDVLVMVGREEDIKKINEVS